MDSTNGEEEDYRYLKDTLDTKEGEERNRFPWMVRSKRRKTLTKGEENIPGEEASSSSYAEEGVVTWEDNLMVILYSSEEQEGEPPDEPED